MPPIQPTSGGIRLTLKVQPRAARTEVAGVHGDALRIRLAAPPVGGAANQALIAFLADRLGVRRAAIVLLSGAASQNKLVEVRGLSADVAASRLWGA